MSNVKRKALAAVMSLVGGAAVLTVSAPPGEASTGCYSLGGGKTNCYVWTAYNYTYRAPNQSLYMGYMVPGWSYFYCQQPGQAYSDHGYTNNWWLRTDDDAHNKNVWLNAVYISSGKNNQPIPGVPRC
jgi:hypothetical protein